MNTNLSIINTMTERPYSSNEVLQTPEDRLNAVLNIVQNGAQTLAVLSMLPNTNQWESPTRINKRIAETVGTPIVHRKTTLQHLVQTIEPVGLAARSTIDNNDWAITEFGIVSRATLIFTWRRFMDMALDPMKVLGST